MIAGVTAATAQTTVITREPVQTETVVTTTQPLQLTPMQRQTVYRTIVRETVAPAQPTVDLSCRYAGAGNHSALQRA